jgi:hypothetical protein
VSYCLRGILIRGNCATVIGKIGKEPYNNTGKCDFLYHSHDNEGCKLHTVGPHSITILRLWTGWKITQADKDVKYQK